MKTKNLKQFNPVKHLDKGWEIIEDTEKLPDEIDLSHLILQSPLKKSESYVTCEKARKRMKGKAVLGGRMLQYFVENPKKWPKGWWGKHVYFDGLLLRSPGGDRCVVYAYRYGARVIVHYYWLDGARHAGLPSALLASTSETQSLLLDTLPSELIINNVTYRRV